MGFALRIILGIVLVIASLVALDTYMDAVYDVSLFNSFVGRCISLHYVVPSADDDNAADNEYEWEYLMLVLSWPETFCEHERETCKVPDEVHGFSIHGLWPQREEGQWVINCPGKPFRIAPILDLLPGLLKYWGNLLPLRGRYSLWRHEWSRHGKCAAYLSSADRQRPPSITSQRRYFKTGVKLRRDYDPLPAWNARGVVPSNTSLYSISDLRSHFEDAYGAKPVVSCRFSAQLQHMAVAEVKICYTRDLEIRECPPNIVQRGCRADRMVMLPGNGAE